jgi:hypothetical protein
VTGDGGTRLTQPNSIFIRRRANKVFTTHHAIPTPQSLEELVARTCNKHFAAASPFLLLWRFQFDANARIPRINKEMIYLVPASSQGCDSPDNAGLMSIGVG